MRQENNTGTPYCVGFRKSCAAGKKRIAEEDIKCFLSVEIFDDKYCIYKGRIFEKGVRQLKRQFVFEQMAGQYFINNAYYAKSSEYDVNAEFIIPAGTTYYHSSLFSDYIAETIIFNRYLESGHKGMLAQPRNN